MEDKTNEQLLLEKTQELMQMLSVMSLFIDGIFKWAKWYSDALDKMPFDIVEKQKALIKFLADNYDLKYKVIDRNEVNKEDGDTDE